jgi:release factor glutamine methyltransferase
MDLLSLWYIILMAIVGEFFSELKNKLGQNYELDEAEKVAILLFEDVLNYGRLEIFLNEKRELSKSQQEKLEKLLSELLLGKPVQYVLGYAWFYGMKLLVNENVLIPRQETEELVRWIIGDIKTSGETPKVIIDYCTGSGCIALALKKEFSGAKIIAIDNSFSALNVAKQNAINEELQIEFIEDNALAPGYSFPTEIIVSNPPYVLQSEKNEMHRRVLNYEPSDALFVPDDDALLFYRQIAEWGKKNLLSGGRIYFETNEQMAKEVADLHLQLGYSMPEIKNDLTGKERMFRAVWN